MLDSSANQMDFEALNGIEEVAELIRDKQVDENLRLGLMVVGGLILASFMTYASEHLATRSFLRFLEDRDATRSRSFC
ncbi:inositol phosphorylceramide glucuronosyltransferase 1-like [Rosa rugosa]|uniref:inositol phosphorylceramide glucuronosyltransferase 1-like n=1 Tax=Rosa rugosa TaxID=74645 RepID=UPI002B4027BD|nr:inositol phosphorylceramide glucuronosyltransferase 1-like [Rosa rugosa]